MQRRCFSWSAWFLEYIRISSMKTMTNLSKYGLQTRFMRSMNAAGAFVSPKGITRNS
ncbi:hypothetical protein HanRHA438_Chr13g0595361 [Helianthus annuus]|nr:hypothetical protein HanRHA438_Chr13g0595361 [Helianthus annuus]